MSEKQSQKEIYAWLPNTSRSLNLLALFGGSVSAQTSPHLAICNRTVTTDVVVFDQTIFYDRYCSVDPGGMTFALERDVVTINSSPPLGAGTSQLRPDKRPRPFVLE